jgi:hypothetical protein
MYTGASTARRRREDPIRQELRRCVRRAFIPETAFARRPEGRTLTAGLGGNALSDSESINLNASGCITLPGWPRGDSGRMTTQDWQAGIRTSTEPAPRYARHASGPSISLCLSRGNFQAFVFLSLRNIRMFLEKPESSKRSESTPNTLCALRSEHDGRFSRRGLVSTVGVAHRGTRIAGMIRRIRPSETSTVKT